LSRTQKSHWIVADVQVVARLWPILDTFSDSQNGNICNSNGHANTPNEFCKLLNQVESLTIGGNLPEAWFGFWLD